MDDQVKKELDMRLVRGEITQQEYREIANTISPIIKNDNPTSNTLPTPSIKQSKLIVESCRLAVYDTHFEHEGRHYNYQEVSSVEIKASKQSINLVPISRAALIMIDMLNEQTTILVSHDATFLQYITARLVKAGQEVNIRSFIWRYQRAVSSLLDRGYLDIKWGSITLTSEGVLKTPSEDYSLIQVNESGILLLGVSYQNWSGRIREYNPHEVVVGKTKDTNSTFVFSVGCDIDVIFKIIRIYATNPPDLAKWKLIAGYADYA